MEHLRALLAVQIFGTAIITFLTTRNWTIIGIEPLGAETAAPIVFFGWSAIVYGSFLLFWIANSRSGR